MMTLYFSFWSQFQVDKLDKFNLMSRNEPDGPEIRRVTDSTNNWGLVHLVHVGFNRRSEIYR